MMRLKLILIFLTGAVIFSCRSFYKLSNQNLAENYDYRQTVLHPRFEIFHEDDTLSALYVEIPKSELLYKKNDSGFVNASVKITCSLFLTYESKTAFDTISKTWMDSDPLNESYLILNLGIKTAAKQFIVRADVKDLNRNQGVTELVRADKRNRQSAQWFMMIPPSVRIPMFRNYASGEEAFSIYSSAGKFKPVYVRCYFREFPVAAPPFAEKIQVQFNYAADSIYRTEIGASSVTYLPKRGMYHFQFDTTSKAGFTVFRQEEDFPKVTDAVQLIECLRYITTNEEYNKLKEAKNKKEAIDAFWLELAGNQDRARTLIRKYYTRIQEANRLFSSYLDGWKTDRGMIYTVMGPPTSVFRTSDSEEWTYGNFNNISSLTFSFESIYNPFSDNDYILRRSGYYEPVWYRMVDRWRQGAVVND